MIFASRNPIRRILGIMKRQNYWTVDGTTNTALSLGLSSYTNGQPECVRHEHPSRVDTVQMEHNYGKSRDWLLAEKTWSSAVIASIAILSRPANISTKHFLETSKDIPLFVLPFSWPDVRRAGRNTKYAVSIIKKMVYSMLSSGTRR